MESESRARTQSHQSNRSHGREGVSQGTLLRYLGQMALRRPTAGASASSSPSTMPTEELEDL
eukprot:1972062-Heterocapsa_arctica.AAC.1